MPIVRIRRTLTASEFVPNLLTGSIFEWARVPEAVRIWASQDGAGAPGVNLDVSVGNAIVSQAAQPNTAATAGNINKDQDGLGDAGAMPGDKLTVAARNADAANPVNVTLLVDIQEL